MMLLAWVWNVGMLRLYAMRRPTGAPHTARPCSMSAPLAVYPGVSGVMIAKTRFWPRMALSPAKEASWPFRCWHTVLDAQPASLSPVGQGEYAHGAFCS